MCTSDVLLKNLPKEKKKLKLHNNLPELISLQPRLCSRPNGFVANNKNNKELVQEQEEDAKFQRRNNRGRWGTEWGKQNTKTKNGKEEKEEEEEETSNKNCY
jgi:hypothetical protein